MGYILEELDKISDPEAKREEAIKLLEVFDSTERWEVPRGIWNPQYDWPKPEEVDQRLREDEGFFSALEQIFGADKPGVFSKIYSRFRRNSGQMRKLSGLDSSGRVRLPHHEFFPFFEGFNDAVQNRIRRGWKGDIDLEEITFTPEVIGKGGYGVLYAAHNPEGQKFALKLFYETHQLPRIVSVEGGYLGDVERTLRNLVGHAPIIAEFPGFVTPRFISSGWKALMHITDFFDGDNLWKILERDGGLNKDREIAGRVLSRYAGALDYLHNNGLLFIDHSPGNILVGEHDVKVCDYDFVSSRQELEDGCLAKTVCTRNYMTKERLLHETPTMLGDLEGFAMVIHHVLSGDIFLDVEDPKKESQERELAKLNIRKYSAPSTIPRNLGRVMGYVLSYPRDDSIRADDFRQAIKIDYGI